MDDDNVEEEDEQEDEQEHEHEERRGEFLSVQLVFDVEAWMNLFQNYQPARDIGPTKTATKTAMENARRTMFAAVPEDYRTDELKCMLMDLDLQTVAEVDGYDSIEHMKAMEEELQFEESVSGPLRNGEDDYVPE